MNYRRVLLGGLLAGVIINISEFLMNGVVLAGQMNEMMADKGLTYAPWAMPVYVTVAFIYGLMLAWLYAAMRPRYGPGLGTAMLAAATLWTASYVIPTVFLLAVELVPWNISLLALAWGAAEVVIAAAVAGYTYHEAVAPSPEVATAP